MSRYFKKNIYILKTLRHPKHSSFLFFVLEVEDRSRFLFLCSRIFSSSSFLSLFLKDLKTDIPSLFNCSSKFYFTKGSKE
jgi:hypothetical protein